MENGYWIGRKHSAMAMARDAATSDARLIHYELAGRYSINAAQCIPFASRDWQDRPTGASAALHVPGPALLQPAPRAPEPHARRDPEA